MSSLAFLQIFAVFLFTISPYAFLVSHLLRVLPSRDDPFQAFAGACISGYAGAVLAAYAMAAWPFLPSAPLSLFLPVAAFVAWAIKRTRATVRTVTPAGSNVLPWLVVSGALLVRLVPVLLNDTIVGPGDFRFHTLLAHKILSTGALSKTWQPFAPIAVVYPQGLHALVALLARLSSRPVHEVLVALVPITGAVTTAAVFLLARTVHGSQRTACWAAACYAFLPFWGSLDTLRWGGLPNAVGMLFVCFLLVLTMESALSASRQRKKATALLVLLAAASGCVHHYTTLVVLLILAAGAIFSPSAPLRRRTATALGLSFVAGLMPQVVLSLLRNVRVTDTGVFVFREQWISLLHVAGQLNPAFVLVAAAAVAAAARARWSARQIFIAAACTALFGGFVALETVYRAVVLILTRGRDCFTALTPSRLATNMTYPLAVLAGGLPATFVWKRHARPATLLLIIAALLACGATWISQSDLEPDPHMLSLAQWIRENTQPDCMIVTDMPNTEYLAWRATSNPPIPASEERNTPTLARLRSIRSLDEWARWQQDNGRRVYFLLPAFSSQAAALHTVKTFGSLRVFTLKKGKDT